MIDIHTIYSDGDKIAHFDCIPSLFSLVYKEMNF